MHAPAAVRYENLVELSSLCGGLKFDFGSARSVAKTACRTEPSGEQIYTRCTFASSSATRLILKHFIGRPRQITDGGSQEFVDQHAAVGNAGLTESRGGLGRRQFASEPGASCGSRGIAGMTRPARYG